ncbi:hypothetical protein, partial [Nocardioides massiliensis]|uniref:hypothetical protein n=1 Tax=Nocardioides massiliensis TaxID=1325935 RepID=UPI001C672D17
MERLPNVSDDFSILSCTDLVGHTVEEFLNVCGDLGPGVDGLAGQADRDVLQGAQGLDEFLEAPQV